MHTVMDHHQPGFSPVRRKPSTSSFWRRRWRKNSPGETALARAQQTAACDCGCAVNLLGEERAAPPTKQEIYPEVTERRFRGINRCC